MTDLGRLSLNTATCKPYTLAECVAAAKAAGLGAVGPWRDRVEEVGTEKAAQLIADTACASWLVLGPAVDTPWRDLDLSAHVVKGFKNGQLMAEGTGKAVLGDPRRALAWFVNEASTFCGGVKAGQFVTTGTCITPFAIAPGDEVTVDYGVLGSHSCRIV